MNFQHCECLAAAYLAIGKDNQVLALQGVLDQRISSLVVKLMLGEVLVYDLILSEGLTKS